MGACSLTLTDIALKYDTNWKVPADWSHISGYRYLWSSLGLVSFINAAAQILLQSQDIAQLSTDLAARVMAPLSEKDQAFIVSFFKIANSST